VYLSATGPVCVSREGVAAAVEQGPVGRVRYLRGVVAGVRERKQGRRGGDGENEGEGRERER
jgi:hypothetical protein